MVEQWFNSGSTEVQQWFNSGSTVVQQWYNSGSTVVQQSTAVVQQWYNSGSTVVQHNNNNSNGFKVRFGVERRHRGPLSPWNNVELLEPRRDDSDTAVVQQWFNNGSTLVQ